MGPQGPKDDQTKIRNSRDVIVALSSLTPREERMLRLKCALPNGSTLNEIGLEFGLTRERIRQILAKAIAKLEAFNMDD